jgi:hypothetical protein
MSTRDDMRKLIGYLILHYPNFNPDFDSKPNVLDAWLDTLQDFAADELIEAVRSCCKEPGRVFAPAPSEIIGAVVSKQTDGIPSPEEGWAMYQQNIRNRIPYPHPFPHNVIRKYFNTWAFDIEPESFARPRFIQAYKTELAKLKFSIVNLNQIEVSDERKIED